MKKKMKITTNRRRRRNLFFLSLNLKEKNTLRMYSAHSRTSSANRKKKMRKWTTSSRIIAKKSKDSPRLVLVDQRSFQVRRKVELLRKKRQN